MKFTLPVPLTVGVNNRICPNPFGRFLEASLRGPSNAAFRPPCQIAATRDVHDLHVSSPAVVVLVGIVPGYPSASLTSG